MSATQGVGYLANWISNNKFVVLSIIVLIYIVTIMIKHRSEVKEYLEGIQ